MRGEGNLYLAWLVALAATLGSLYFSEVRHFVPCTLCWYQRILMYPLAIVLGIASYRQASTIRLYVLPLSILGIGFATYHVLEQHIPGFGAPGLCKAGIPCSLHYIDWLGFITIPLLSLVAFALITLLLASMRRGRNAGV
ncbi:MAG: disulfide oxidoreductase [Deinococcales bacterium]|jgi:disulfide bond formation protein DsbB